MARRLLIQAGHQVEVAGDGEEAMALLRGARPLPDLLLSDVRMPRMDGIELCNAIRANPQTRALKVILVTALADPGDLARGLEAGADNYIIKPYQDAYLLAKVQEELADEPDQPEQPRVPMVISFGGHEYRADVVPGRLVKLLISTYDTALQQNKELLQAQIELKAANQSLEHKIKALEQSQNALQESDSRLRSLVNVTPEIVFKLDAEGRFTYLNDAVRMLGYAETDLLGRHFSVLLDEGEIEQVSRSRVLPRYAGEVTGDEQAPKLFDERRTGLRSTRGLVVALRRNPGDRGAGSQGMRYGEVCSAGFYQDQEQQELLGTIGTITDITQRREMERELELLNQNLENLVDARTRELYIANQNMEKMLKELNYTQLQVIQSEKMAALGTLMGGVAHELNNPLMGTLNYVQHVHDHIDDEGLRGYLLKAEANVKRAGNIVQNMLSFSRSPDKELERVDLAEVVASTLELVEAEFRHRDIRVEVEMPEGFPPVWGRRTGFQQVLLNLMTNARDALEGGATAEPVLHIEGLDQGERILLVASDNGHGLEHSKLMRIFDPFFTTKAPGKGTGLGLSVSANLIASFGGNISCESAPGEGARFIIELPRENPATIKNERHHEE
ncbi:MAG: hypothetical protein B0D88_00900 [Candidatus Sedimenticola endophacoides]|nr:MAG: hypothetical protein B0D88_00900 [Candidatus Sedimenticola endophacoides]